MTMPRQVLPNATYLLSRRCFGRMLFLRPSDATNQLFLYILAVAAKRTGVRVHALCVMSNHFHCVVTDPLGALPRFEQYLAGLVARSFNASLGRWESFWAPGSYSAVRLVTTAAILDKVAYTMANPVESGLVQHGSEWPGLWLAAGLTPATKQVARPSGFFRTNGPMPEVAILTLVPPPDFESGEAFGAQVAPLLRVREEEAARKLALQGRSFMGPAAVKAQKRKCRPANCEPRRGLSPRIASRDKWKRIEALSRLKEFALWYREAWREFARGARDALFPAGTYWMRVAHGVRCAPS